MSFLNYDEEKRHLLENYIETNRFLEVNKVLDKYGWHFINPYIQVFKLEHLISQEQAGNLNKEKVSNFFIQEFFDLNMTLSFTDGYFNRSEFISPYNYFIESSLILCFQKDYAASINILIPVIEATIIEYFKVYRKVSIGEGKRYEKIKNAVSLIKEDILIDYKNKYEFAAIYNKQQIKYLMSLHRRYYNNWVSIIDDFLKDSLFAHSENNHPDNYLNRHSILHLLEINKYNSIENYIKLFNCLKFLSWLFLRLEKKSILNNIEPDVFLDKRLLYEELIKVSDNLTSIKYGILKGYELSNKSDLAKNVEFKSINQALSSSKKLYLFTYKRWLLIKNKSQLRNNNQSL